MSRTRCTWLIRHRTWRRSCWTSGGGSTRRQARSSTTSPTRSLSTRFLGDLYQDLSEQARKDYALLQTPEFVEEFILDRTLDPAVEEFGLAEVRMIDPTCGSGHFLLGAFARLLQRWRQLEPGVDVRVHVERVLRQVNGVDINPFAVAIARFRLLVAALTSCGIERLKDAPTWRIRVGDRRLLAVRRPAGTRRAGRRDRGGIGRPARRR